jgi:hypothetical protein
VLVTRADQGTALRGTRKLESYDEAVPFVAEVWSRTTGTTDREDKPPALQARGDQEIWLMHPYERWADIFRRQADGSYTEVRLTGGIVALAFVPGVTIDLDALFEPD